MANALSGKGLAPFICRSCRASIISSPRRPFTTPSSIRAQGGLDDASGTRSGRTMAGQRNTEARNSSYTSILDRSQEEIIREELGVVETHEPHRLHIFAHKHNTHLTFVQPSRSATQTPSSRISATTTSAMEQKKMVDVLISVSAGNIGFRKAGRGSYDAAYQLAAYTLKQIQEKNMLYDVKKLEVVLRGFGAGREAVTKVLLGSEGRHIRDKITSVKDATRLKQGGARAKKPRRLG